MAHPPQLRSWILRAATSRAVRIEQGTWISEFFPNLTDITASITINGDEVVGRAFGETEDLALTKAIAEMLERSIVIEQRIPNSNGMAAHLTSEAAAVNASQELWERDLFLCHFLTRTPLAPVLQDPQEVDRFKQWLDEQGAKLTTYELGDKGRVCAIDGRKAKMPFGFIFSTAWRESPKEATIATIISAGRRAHRLLTSSNPPQKLTLDEFLQIERPTFQHHGQLALDLNYADSISELFSIGPSAISQAPPTYTTEITILKPQNPRLAECPLVVARATSPHAQNLFTGTPTREKVNLERLSAFAGRPLAFEGLNPLPHPFD